MSNDHVIVLVCLLGIIGESLRLVRPGQVLLAPGLLGRWGQGAAPSLLAGESFTLHLAPLFAMGPALRFSERAADPALAAAAHLDLERARLRLAQVRQATDWVVTAGQLVLLTLVVLAPVVLLTGRVPHRWLVLGVSVLAVQILLLVTFWVGHRRLHPHEGGRLVQHLITLAFFPPAGVFAADRLAADAVDGIHPLAAALVLCPEREAGRIAGRYLRSWQFAGDGGEGGRAAAYLAAAREVLAAHGLDPQDCDLAPRPDGAASLAYCPRCRAQFTRTDGECADCPGVAKVSFL